MDISVAMNSALGGPNSSDKAPRLGSITPHVARGAMFHLRCGAVPCIAHLGRQSHLLTKQYLHRRQEDLLAMVLHTFALMHGPLVRLLPDRDPAEIALLARMMFSAVHGIISLGLEERLVAVPPESLRVLVRQFVKTHLIGIGVVARD